MGYDEYCQFVSSKLISSRADSLNNEASISVGVEINRNNTLRDYLIERIWSIKNGALEEAVAVYESDKQLSYEEKEELLNSIKEQIPPSLLDVIVFDGENVIQILSDNKMSGLIKGIINSVFGMDVYVKLSKDLGTYLHSAKSDETISSDEQIGLLELENNYRSSLSKSKQLSSLFESAKDKNKSLIRKMKNLSNTFSQKTGIKIDEIEKLNESIAEIEKKKEIKDAEIRYINEEILPFKMVQKKLEKILVDIDGERSFYVLKSISELKKYFSESADALNKISDLEKMIQAPSVEFKYNLSEEEYKTVTNTIALLNNYSKAKLLDNLDEKSDFAEKIQKEMVIAGKADDPKSKELVSELEVLYEEIEKNNTEIIKLQKEFEDNNIVLNEAKKQYELLKKEILGRKKSSNSYSNVMLYREAIDQFISENVNTICDSLNRKVTDELKSIHFRNDSIDHVEISPKSFEMKVFETGARLIPSDLFSAGEKQLLLGLVIKEALSLSHNDTFFLFDTPVGRLDSGNRKLFTNEVIFKAASQVFVFATDSDYSKNDYESIKNHITSEMVLKRDEYDQIVMVPGSMY